MTEENLNVEEKECKCFCKSEGVKKFVVVAAGTFVGVFCALSLFAALHRPPMMPCPCHGPGMMPPIHHGHHFRGFQGPKGGFEYKMIKKGHFEKQIPGGPERAPFEGPRGERADK